MPKEYGQLRHDIWSDDDWLNLTVPAQHLYMTLLSDPTLNYCGVADWRIGKLAQRAAENRVVDTFLAAGELSHAHFLVIDEETEEVLIRSYLRHDPLLKNPRLAVTMSKEYGVIGSRKIRAALVYELGRLKRENPDWLAWEKPSVKTVLRQNAVSAKDMDTDLPAGAAMYLPNGLPSEMGKRDLGFTSGLQRATSNVQHATFHSPSSNEDAVPLAAKLSTGSGVSREGIVKASHQQVNA
ncbi:MAG TPA: hypothetical protein VFU07_07245 [Candidatus Lumbricidophila sp.]|nr:hypothetical protein [Candidatus Lumbricidophila sp.]